MATTKKNCPTNQCEIFKCNISKLQETLTDLNTVRSLKFDYSGNPEKFNKGSWGRMESGYIDSVEEMIGLSKSQRQQVTSFCLEGGLAFYSANKKSYDRVEKLMLGLPEVKAILEEEEDNVLNLFNDNAEISHEDVVHALGTAEKKLLRTVRTLTESL